MGIPNGELELAREAGKFYKDPLGFANFAFPWGETGGPLEKFPSLRGWQREWLGDLGVEIAERAFDGVTPVDPIQCSTVSGHGPGKSALVGIVSHFINVTRPDSRGVVTASTIPQLRTKTWPEIGKWLRMSMFSHWFDFHGGAGNLSVKCLWNPDGWRMDGQTSKEENSESFAGLHAAQSTPYYIFDEASGIPEKIFEVAQGGLTDGEPMWFLFGNGTRNSGFFRNTHGNMSHRWRTKQIDSRTVEGTNRKLFARWAEDYGEESDFFKVRVRGMFPSASSLQLIDELSVAMARRRAADPKMDDPLIMAIDIARGGSARNVIYWRRGADAKSIPYKVIPGSETRDTMRMVALIAVECDQKKPDAVFIDGTGIGGPIGDRLRQLGINVIDVVGAAPSPTPKNANMRTHMWVQMRDALRKDLAIPDFDELQEDLVAPEYGHNKKDLLQLETKEDMEDRGLRSPDVGDALAMTFAIPVPRKDSGISTQSGGKLISEYDPLDAKN